jgi:hypothetical protein
MTDAEIARGAAIFESGKYARNGAEGNGHRPEPGGAQLLNDIRSFLARFVIYPTAHALDAHTLWIAHAWLTDAFESTPRIAFLSPEPGSGKSRALEVTEPLVPHPVHAVNTTPAYLFRKVAERGDDGRRPTILYDEIDTVFGPKAKDNEDIRGMLNAGHRKGAVAGRCTVRGGQVKTEEIDAYCAVALAGLDDLPDTIMTRSVVVRMKRRAPSEPVEPWRHRVNRPEAAALASRLAAWAGNVTADVTDRWPEMPESVTDRAADVWEALLIVADQAGGHWPESARVAAVTAVTELSHARQSLGVTLLRDLRTIFNRTGAERFVTDQLITNLKEIDQGIWAVIRKGEPIDARRLASLLRKYGIEPKPQRDGTRVFKGYARTQFEDAWSRYLPPETSVTSVTQSTDEADRCTDCGTVLEHINSIAVGRCAECQVINAGTS